MPGKQKKNPKKIKGKWKLAKQSDKQMQGDCNIPMPFATSQTIDETINEHDTETENLDSQENPQRNCNNTTNTTSNDELNAIIGSLIEEMRSL